MEDLSEYSDKDRIRIYQAMIKMYKEDTDRDNDYWIKPLQYKIDAINNKKHIRVKNIRYKIQEDISEKNYRQYIKENWSKKEIADFWDRINKQFDSLGKSIGIYHQNKLIGFVFYDDDLKKRNYPGWFANKLDMFQNYKPIYYATNLEIQKQFRRNGLASILLNKIYNKMPTNSLLIAESVPDDNHVKFYTYNGFTFNLKDNGEYALDGLTHYTMYKFKQ